VASVGHVRDLLKSRLSVDVDNGFEPEYRVPKEKREVVKGLKSEVAKSHEVFLATDPDREGEAIAWHLLEAAAIEPEQARRVVFHEITESAVHEAFEHPRMIDMNLVRRAAGPPHSRSPGRVQPEPDPVGQGPRPPFRRSRSVRRAAAHRRP
jgi:DNA topoisomerase-1